MTRTSIKTIMTGALFFLSFISIAQIDTENWKELDGDYFHLSYPSDWELIQMPQMEGNVILVSALTSPEDKFKENINLLRQDLTGQGIDLDQFVEISEEQVKTLITDGDILQSERKNDGKYEYHFIVFTGTQGLFQLKFVQQYWVIDEQAIVLTFTCESSVFTDYAEVSEAIFGTVKMK